MEFFLILICLSGTLLIGCDYIFKQPLFKELEELERIFG